MANIILNNDLPAVVASSTLSGNITYNGADLDPLGITTGSTLNAAFTGASGKVNTNKTNITTNTTNITTNTASIGTINTSLSVFYSSSVKYNQTVSQESFTDTSMSTLDAFLGGMIDDYTTRITAVTTSSGTTLADVATSYDPLIDDHVDSGFAVSSTAGLVVTLALGITYINGAKVSASADSDTLTASKDNYVNIKSDGSHNVQTVTVGASAPTVPAGEINIWMFTTNGSAITVQTDKRNYKAFSAARLGNSVTGTANKLSKFSATNVITDSVLTELSSKIGLNTSTPAKALEINSSDGNNLRLTYNDADGSATNYADILTTSGGLLSITASGAKVGIGTTAPDKAFEINSADGSNLRLTYNDSNGSATNYTDFALSSSGDLTITPSGGDATIVATTSIDLKSPVIDMGENDASDVTINLLGSTNDMAILYDESAKTLAFDTNDFTIDGANGRVGVGTASPGALTHLYKIAVASDPTPLEMLRLEIEDTGVDMNAGHGPAITFYVGETSGSDWGGTLAVVREVESDADSASAMVFHTAIDDTYPAERMRIASTGYVGINETTPSAHLHISGTSGVFAARLCQAAETQADGIYIDSPGSSNSIRVYLNNNVAYYGRHNGSDANAKVTMGMDHVGNTTFINNVTVGGNMIITDAVDGIVHTNSGTVTQGTNITTAVTLNATSGVITMYATAIAAAENIEFTVTNSTVQADSVVLLSMQDENTTDNAQLVCATHTIAGGSFKVTVANPAATGASSATAVKIHFLIINNS